MTYTPLALVDARIYLDSCDFTGNSNKIDMKSKVDELMSTTFGSGGWQTRVGGLTDADVKVETYWQAGDNSLPDNAAMNNLGLSTVAFTAIPSPSGGVTLPPTVGDVAYLTKLFEGTYTIGGGVGELLTGNVEASGEWPMVLGQVMHPHGTARTATGTSTPVQIGAVSATQGFYACLHVLSIAGTSTPSIAVKIQSSDASGGTYADRITFDTATAIGGQASRVTGAITDTWWRASYTITGTSPSFLFAITGGVAHK